ncbi:MAG: hypothetical protein CMD84_02350 [Gammaproteobacteria bacterium]|mgnify:FL=1|nr:hypothetical protein [Gammaproteobacteria bacterium]
MMHNLNIITKKINDKFIFYDKDVKINIEELFLNDTFSSNETKNVEWINNNKWVKKHYFRKGMMAFMKDLYLYKTIKHTRSYREFEILNYLYKAGFNTCKPVMGWVSYGGIFYKANLITESIPAETLSEYYTHKVNSYIDNKQEEKLFIEIGKQIANMHLLNIFHGDLNMHNILVKGNIIKGEKICVWILDFDKSMKKKLTKKDRESNLKRMKLSLAKHEFLSVSSYSKILKGYDSIISS